MVSKEVKLIEYSKHVDFLNCLTHALSAVFFLIGGAAAIKRAAETHSARIIISAVIYSLSLVAVYTVSAVYHGLPQGENKRRARLLDHSTIPMLIAGTATPCALITLYKVSAGHAYFVFILAWLCAAFGVFSKLFFFEKLKSQSMSVYIIGGAIMLLSVIPLIGGGVNSRGFMWLIIGSAVYLFGAAFCGLGIKRPVLHIVFHLLVSLGSAIHFYVLYTMVF